MGLCRCTFNVLIAASRAAGPDLLGHLKVKAGTFAPESRNSISKVFCRTLLANKLIEVLLGLGTVTLCV